MAARLQPMGIRAVAENVRGFTRKVDSMNKSIGKTNKELGKSKKSAKDLEDGLDSLSKGFVAIAAAALTFKKAFEFGRQGALVTQTGESFEFLLEKIGAAPDLLNQLQEASKGTITDLQLMSSTATLLAGAGDELATKLANATPRLLEIAKAANKLNPALGDTAFLYQSIATGVKRAQPLILDNLGITIKVGEANEEFAKSIGKTVEELNAEEKAMAILNGTLEAGNNLIQQVGGNTDSLTDDFDRATVAVTQAGDALKTKLAPFLTRSAQGLFEVLTQADRMIVALEEQEHRTRMSADSWEEYNDEMLRLEIVSGRARNRFGALTSELDLLIAQFKDANAPTRKFGETVVTVVEEMQEKLQPALILDINIQRGLTALGRMSSFLNTWSQEQQQKLRLQVHVETTLEAVEAGGTGLEEFQHGGQFQVGGKGGVDQNVVAFRASRGEVVTVTPQNQVNNRNFSMGDVSINNQMNLRAFDSMMRQWLGQ